VDPDGPSLIIAEEEEEEEEDGDRSGFRVGSAMAVGSRVPGDPFLKDKDAKHGSRRLNANGHERASLEATGNGGDANATEEELSKLAVIDRSRREPTAEQIAARYGIKLSSGEEGSDSLGEIGSDDLEAALRLADDLFNE
jgi:hypothetical protein